MTACEDCRTIFTNTSNTKVTKKHAKAVNNPIVHVDSVVTSCKQNPVNTPMSYQN